MTHTIAQYCIIRHSMTHPFLAVYKEATDTVSSTSGIPTIGQATPQHHQ